MQKDINTRSTYKLSVMTTESTLFQNEVISAIFPGSYGTFEILANHAPIIALVEEGSIVITEASGQKTSIHTSGGFLEVYKNQSTLLC